MKKFKKNDLRLEKEVISQLTQDELTSVKGGLSLAGGNCADTYQTCYTCPPPVFDVTYKNCQSINQATCALTQCKAGCLFMSDNINCKPMPATHYSKQENCTVKTATQQCA